MSKLKKVNFKLSFAVFRNLTIGILLLILGGVIGYRYGAGEKLPFSNQVGEVVNTVKPIEKADVDFATFWEVWSLLETTYLEPEKLDNEDMVHGAISGMTRALGDPYTTYLPPADNQRNGEDLAGSFFGVGIELGYVDEVLAVVAPLKGTPADEAGIQAGDLILHVKDEGKGLDEDTTGWTLNEAVEKIRGKKGTTVELTLFRKDNGVEPFVVPVKRGEIVVESVELEFVEHAGKRVAHLRLSRFGERTMSEWNQAVQSILSQKSSIDGVVLDLRNNPGGFFDASVDIAGDFIRNGVVVSQQGRFTKQDFPAKGGARLTNIPTIILVNRGSASASEIVAGALRDQLGAKLVGEKTFGKGTIQDRRELSNGGGIHVTVGRWLLPKGSWIHEEGLPVDVEVEQNRDTEEDEVLLKAVEQL